MCYFATTEGDQPRVRAVLMWFADEKGFYFAVLSPKKMSRQLHKNPKVEVCFYNYPTEIQHGKMMRVTGEVEFLEDEALKKKIYEERKFLDDLAGQSIEPFVEVIRITSGEAYFWTMTDTLKEDKLEHIKFYN